MKDLPPGERLARAVLLFYSDGHWTRERQQEWLDLTGKLDATTRELGDLARAILMQAES